LAPTGELAFGWQAEQFFELAAEYVPASQYWQAVLALASLKVPSSQLAQAVSPDAALKEPGTQALQASSEPW